MDDRERSDKAALPPGCPSPAQLARAVSARADEPDAPLVMAHLRVCPGCERSWRQQRELLAIAARMPFVPPSLERRRQLRDEILAKVAPARGPRPQRRAFWLSTAALSGAVALALVLLVRHRPGRDNAPAASATALPPSRAVIEAKPGARFVRTSGRPHEVIRLYEGQVRFTVEHAASADESFVVVTGLGQVEVRGTIFETTAKADRLVKVSVQRGKVLVRQGTPQDHGAEPASDDDASDDAQDLALEAGHSWERTENPATAPAGDLPLPILPVPHKIGTRLATPGPRPPRTTDPATVAFGQGMAMLRASNLTGAAAVFERAATMSRNGTLAEEASYWHAVLLNRSGEQNGGHDALKNFLDRFPRSPRAGEASVRLGWLLLDRGDRQAASLRFRAGLDDGSTIVRKSAQAGLDATFVRDAQSPPR